MRTVLFGLDGATFSVLDPLMADGDMPNLKRLCDQGVRGTLLSTPHPITPQAWTSLATGRSAGHHGFTDFLRLEYGRQGPLLRFNTSFDIGCESIWHYASNHDKRATVLNYIGLAPPKPLNGHTMPGFVPGRHLRRASHPPDLFTRLASLPELDVEILGLDLKIERRSLQNMPEADWLEWIDHHQVRERAWFQIMEHLMREEPSDLTMIVFDGVDKIQHLAYPYMDPAHVPSAPSAWERQVMESCRAYFRQIDAFLGRLMDLIGSNGRIVIASDHGFCATDEVLYINRFLHDEGYLHWRTDQEEDQDESIVVEQLTRFLDVYDWQQTTAFALTPSSNGIYIMNVPASAYEAFRDELIAKLYALKGPDGGQVITDVKKREDYFGGPKMGNAPDLTLTLRDHGFFSVLHAKAAVVPRQRLAGTHHPDGVLLAMGPGMHRGRTVERLDILDVAPLLAHSIGLPIPSDYEGTFPAALYEEAYLAEDPPRVLARSGPAAGEGSGGGGGDADLDAEDEEVLMERLRSLGYVE